MTRRLCSGDSGPGTLLAAALLGVLLCSCAGDSSSTSSSGGDPGGANPTGGPGGKGGTELPYESRFTLVNDADVERTEVVQVSIPFPEGKVTSLDNHSVKERSTAWRVLQRWPDGSVRVALAQFAETLPARSTQAYEVVSGTPSYRGAFERNPWVSALWSGFVLATEVKDVDGVAYYATLGEAVPMIETPLVRTTRHRSYHIAKSPGLGIKRDFLSLTAYVTEFRSTPVVQIDLILGNDYLGADDPKGSTDPNLHALGDVYIKEFNVAVANNPVLFRFAAQNRIGEPYQGSPGVVYYPMLRESYLADGQVKRWRALVLFNHPQGSPEERNRVMATWNAMAGHSLKPVATLTTWRGSRAMGLFGGPVDPVEGIQGRAEKDYQGWLGRDHFGPFGSWGDTRQSGTTGTPRNGPVSPEMIHIVQSGYGKLVDKLEGLAWQQGCRPLHLWNLKVQPETDIYLWTGLPFSVKGARLLSTENLGRKALYDNDIYAHWRTGTEYGWNGPHDWNAFDNEHWTTDLLFDYWTLTGDCRAQDDLAHMGECAMGLLRGWKYPTQWPQAARCEGWMLASAIQVWLATGEERLRAHFLDRIRRIVEVHRRKEHPSKAICFQQDYPGTCFPNPHKFYMPWQHGSVLIGYCAAAKFWKESLALTIAEDVVPAIEYAWVANKQDPKYGLVENGVRFHVPIEYQGTPVAADFFDSWKDIGVRWGDSPLGGAHSFLIAGFFYLSDMTSNRSISDRAANMGTILLRAQMGSPEWRWEKWSATVPEYHVP